MDASCGCSQTRRTSTTKTASPTGYRQTLCLSGLQEDDAYLGIPSRCRARSPSGRCWSLGPAAFGTDGQSTLGSSMGSA